MKFGGTSVEDAKAIRSVSRIVRDRRERKPVVVASACAGVTDALVNIARNAVNAGRGGALPMVEALRERHLKIARDLLPADVLSVVEAQIDSRCDELRDLARSIGILGELTDRSLDIFMSCGEKLSTLLFYHQLVLDGVNTVLLNAQDIVVTSSDFTRAVPDFDATRLRAVSALKPQLDQGKVVLTQGFLGATAEGVPTTLGRGGSDYSAAILGSVLGADEIQIWTDVDGILTCDPSVIADARMIEELTFREAAELAYFGAKVLHPATILPAVQKNIPVRVLNSRRPEGTGTIIVRESAKPQPGVVRAIAYKKHISLINITSTRMLMMHGFLAKVFEVFARYERSVDVIATSEVSISLTVDSEARLELILRELAPIADVDVAKDKSIVCVVGERLKDTGEIVPRVFSTLERNAIPVRLISLGASEINITFVVDGTDVVRTAQVLHTEFFGQR